MLSHRLRHCPNIKTALGQYIAFAGKMQLYIMACLVGVRQIISVTSVSVIARKFLGYGEGLGPAVVPYHGYSGTRKPGTQ